MAKTRLSAKEFFWENPGNPAYADQIDSLLKGVQTERGFRSENMAQRAFAQLKEWDEILDFEDATGTLADYHEATDFWVTLKNGIKRRVQVKSSAHHIRVHSHEEKYQDISFLVVKDGESIADIINKIRQHILPRYR